MRVVTLKSGVKFNVRGLTRKEYKELRSNGINLVNLQPEGADEAIDAVFEIIFHAGDLERINDLYVHESLQIWEAAMKETFGSKEEEKN